MKLWQVLVLSLLLLSSCNNTEAQQVVYQSSDLKITQIAPSTYIHISYLKTDNFGKVACNGMIVVDSLEAIIYDTPTTIEASKELIEWVKKDLKAKINAIIPTHFHGDCLGGLSAFHEDGVPSFSQLQTITLAKQQNAELPMHGFEKTLRLKLGNSEVINQYFGAGHTNDNIVGYFEKDEVLFGGCLIKTLKAGEGNLADADVKSWPITVLQIKNNYPNLKLVIPGHGPSGTTALLDYTMEMFSN